MNGEHNCDVSLIVKLFRLLRNGTKMAIFQMNFGLNLQRWVFWGWATRKSSVECQRALISGTALSSMRKWPVLL